MPRRGVSSVGLLWPAASLLSHGRQCKSDGNVTGTQRVATKHTRAPVSLVVPPCQALVGYRSEGPSRQSDGQKQLLRGSESLTVPSGDLQGATLQRALPGLHWGVLLRGPLSLPLGEAEV